MPGEEERRLRKRLPPALVRAVQGKVVSLAQGQVDGGIKPGGHGSRRLAIHLTFFEPKRHKSIGLVGLAVADQRT